VRFQVGGSWRELQSSFDTLWLSFAMALCLVFLLTGVLFEAILLPFSVILSVPPAFAGAFWALYITGKPLDPLAMLGTILLVGIVVNNGIVMVDHVNALRRAGKERGAALIEGCGDRLRPVLMTVITTVVGLLPLALSEFTVAGIYVQSMAVAMIGGLISSTVFTLIALPVWYTAIEDLAAVLLGLLPTGMAGRPRPKRAVLADRV
jgi:HAE1 family hydrophobic/amphiphilic exporter-1